MARPRLAALLRRHRGAPASRPPEAGSKAVFAPMPKTAREGLFARARLTGTGSGARPAAQHASRGRPSCASPGSQASGGAPAGPRLPAVRSAGNPVRHRGARAGTPQRRPLRDPGTGPAHLDRGTPNGRLRATCILQPLKWTKIGPDRDGDARWSRKWRTRQADCSMEPRSQPSSTASCARASSSGRASSRWAMDGGSGVCNVSGPGARRTGRGGEWG